MKNIAAAIMTATTITLHIATTQRIIKYEDKYVVAAAVDWRSCCSYMKRNKYAGKNIANCLSGLF